MIAARLRKWLVRMVLGPEALELSEGLSKALHRIREVQSKHDVLVARVEELDRTALVAMDQDPCCTNSALPDVRTAQNIVVCTALDARLAGVLPLERVTKP